MYKVIGSDNREYGPASEETVRRWIAEGRANAQSQAQAEGETGWRTLGSFPEFAAGGKPLGSFGRPGLGRVEFFKPRGLAFDARGRLVVVDWGNHRGQILTGDGEFVGSFGARLFVQPTLR